MEPFFVTILNFLAVLKCGLGSSQTSQRYTEGGATDVVVADHMAELDRTGVSTMLTANTNFQVGTNSATISDSSLHQSTNTITVQLLEGILFKDTLINIDTQEGAFSVVTAITKGHLGQVVGAK